MRNPLLAFLLLVSAVGCARYPVRFSPPLPEGRPCLLAGPVGTSAEALDIHLGGSIGFLLAPVPQSDAERVLFRNLYPGIVTVDCDGRVGGGLEASLRDEEGGRVWTLRLGEESRRPDGSLLVAEEVLRSWRAVHAKAPGAAPWLWIDPDSVRVVAPRTLRVRLGRPIGDHPALFSHAALAVVGSDPGEGIPGGVGGRSGAVPQLRREGDLDHGGTWVLTGDRGSPEIRVHVYSPAGDPRDILDRPGRAVLVRERQALEYAERLPGRRVLLLPLDRVYALAWRPEEPDADRRHDDAAALRRRIAARTLPAIAEEVTALPWGSRQAPCPPALPEAAGAGPGGRALERILHDGDDPVARALAEAAVAWALGSGVSAGRGTLRTASPDLHVASSLRAEPAAAAAISAALRAGDPVAAVWRIDAEFGDPCLDGAAAGFRLGGAPGSILVAPLVATRAALVLPPDWGAVAVDGCGVPLFFETPDGGGEIAP